MKFTTNLTIGADPELFVYDRMADEFLSAHDLFPGTKWDPFPTAKGAIQVDGVAAEFNIAPASNSAEFRHNINQVYNTMSLILNKMSKSGTSLMLAASPVATFEKEYFNSLPEETKALGCNPDFNAYTGKPNDPPHTDEPFRTGAGHIHIGWTEDADINDVSHIADCVAVVKQLDATLFIPSLAWDHDSKRRTLYGAPGSYRPKSYGVEYRVLSNAWVTDPDIQEWLFDATKESVVALENGDHIYNDKQYKKFMDLEAFYRTDMKGYMAFLAKHGIPELPEELWGIR